MTFITQTTYRRSPWLVGFLAALLLSVAGPAPSTAQSPRGDRTADRNAPSAEEKERFAKLVKKGKHAYSNGDFEEALPHFQRAYDIIAHPGLHYRIALCHERAGRPKKAIARYRRFLKAKPDTSKRGAVEKRIARLKQQTRATVRVESTPSSAQVFVRRTGAGQHEETPRGTTPMEMTVEPGTLEIILKKDGYPTRRRTIEPRAGRSYEYAWELAKPGSNTSVKETVALTAAITGGIGILSYGTFFGIGKHCMANRPSCSSGLYSTSVIGSYTGGLLGLAGLTTALVLWQTTDDSGPWRRTPVSNLRLEITPGGVQLSGQF